jgi:phenylacetate-CoA ligase
METEPPPYISPPLKIKVEHGPGVEQSQLSNLAKEIEDQMSQLYKVRSKVEFVLPETLGRVTKKTPLFEEKYR